MHSKFTDSVDFWANIYFLPQGLHLSYESRYVKHFSAISLIIMSFVTAFHLLLQKYRKRPKIQHLKATILFLLSVYNKNNKITKRKELKQCKHR